MGYNDRENERCYLSARRKRDDGDSSFYDLVHKILVDYWNKSNTVSLLFNTLTESEVISKLILVFIAC